MVDSISAIQNTIEARNDFSFVDSIGSFIGNRGFGEPFEQFSLGQGNPKTFVWESLSAIGNEIGKVIHTNIRDYIDLVSNVDRCKVIGLQSMFQMYGQKYGILENVSRYPIEVQNLVDLFSINKKYLLKNDFLNEDFRRELEECNAISSIEVDQHLLSSYDIQNTSINEQRYCDYVQNVFKTLLYGFLDMEYNDVNHTKVRKDITEDELLGYSLSTFQGLTDETIQQFKKSKNIPQTFDENAIVDAIDSGRDFLDNYNGVQREVLEMEIQRRAATLTLRPSITKEDKENDKSLNQYYQSVQQKTRYSYYRKAKLLEYYRFIKNFFSSENELSAVETYDYDQTYFLFTKGDEWGGPLVLSGDEYVINEQMVESASEMLKDIVQYISNLRERLKLQTRKNYMRGTSNLLIYLINQYIVDYAKSQTKIFKQLDGTELSGLHDTMRWHSTENVRVVEYYDQTEYFNISSKTNPIAVNGSQFNDRYWEGDDRQTSEYFDDEQLEKFYLKDLALSSNGGVGDLYKFLDTIFNLGASTSHIDKDIGIFSAKLNSEPDLYSAELNAMLSNLTYHWNRFCEFILSDYPYSYPQDQVSNQISNVVDEYISGYLSVQYLSAVSSVYDNYIDDVHDISSDIDRLSVRYENFLNDEYNFYFQPSKRDEFWDNGVYVFPYYIGNQEYQAFDIYSKIDTLMTFSQTSSDSGAVIPGSNIRFRPLISTVMSLSSNLVEMSSQYLLSIYKKLEGYGYVDISSLVLGDSLQDSGQFVENRIAARLEYLKTSVQNMFQAARDINSEVGTLNASFETAVLQYTDSDVTSGTERGKLYCPDLVQKSPTSEEYWQIKNGSVPPKDSSTVTITKKFRLEYTEGSTTKIQWFYKTSPSRNGAYTVDEFSFSFDSSMSLMNKATEMLAMCQFPLYKRGDVEYYRGSEDGLVAACESIISRLNELQGQYDQLIIDANSFGIDTSSFSGGDVSDKINEFINFLATVDPEENFKDDPVITDLNAIKRTIIQYKSEYAIQETRYQGLPTEGDFSQYLAGFQYKSTEYSFQQLEKIFEYIFQTDQDNTEKVVKQVQEMLDEYNSIDHRFHEVELSASQEFSYEYSPNGQTIEEQLTWFEDGLLLDIQKKTSIGIKKINDIMAVVRTHMAGVSSHISSSMDSEQSLSDVVLERMESYKYLDLDVYKNQKTLFDMYNGLCSQSDLYYNYKNITHPSRQYHPYMWNFIDVDDLENAAESIFNTNTIENLNEGNIQRYIDQYIGTFGQSINFWKNDGIDQTGYSSKYEMSEHLVGSKGIRFQKVVDYDGAFFPDAVAYLLSVGYEKCISSIQFGIDRSNPELSSFYADYYLPLELTQTELKLEQTRISAFHDQIEKIVSAKIEPEAYDMYKYGRDENGNSYCLFKRYKDSDGEFFPDARIPYSVKKNTPGKLWVRKQSYPFAFPAFGDNGILEIDSQYTALSNSVLPPMSEDQKKEPEFGKIYDFEFTKNNAFLAIFTENLTEGGLKAFDSAYSFSAQVSKITDFNSGDYRLQIRDRNLNNYERVEKVIGDAKYSASYTQISAFTIQDVYMSSAIQVAESEMSVVFLSDQLSTIDGFSSAGPGTPIDHLTSQGGELTGYRENYISDMVSQEDLSCLFNDLSTRYYEGPSDKELQCLVGCTLNGIGNFFFVYALKNIRHVETEDGKWVDEITLPSSTIFSVVDYNSQKLVQCKTSYPRPPTTGDVVVSMCDTGTMAIGTLIKSALAEDGALIEAYSLSGDVLDSNNCVGYVREDPLHNEMNSHDVFSQDIYVKKFTVKGRMKELKVAAEQYNINADMSYVPLYPGKKEILEVQKKEELVSASYYPIELLGQSRNIDDLIELVNPTPNPYFSIDDISANYCFGRVYEDYFFGYDKTLKIIDNPPINNNTDGLSGVSYNQDRNCLVWEIVLSDAFLSTSYTEKDYRNLNVIMFNRGNYGKNPYLVCDMSSMFDHEVLAKYNDSTKGIEVNVGNGIDATGTYDNELANSTESNKFWNISSLTMKFGWDNRTLSVLFHVDDPLSVDHTYIDQGDICLVLANERDLTMFKYYHYLDAYGLYISAEVLDFSMYEDRSSETFSIGYDRDFINGKLSSGIWNYYYDQYGYKRYLRDVNFEEYDQLSDIEVLQGYKKALFKYDEELNFDIHDDNYYYPTINLKYPKTYGQYMVGWGRSLNKAADTDLTSVFKDYELFIIDIPEFRSVLSSIGRVRIDISSDEADILMADESCFMDGRNNTYYGVEDARSIEYLMLTEPSTYDAVTVETSCSSMTEALDFVNNQYGMFAMATEDAIAQNTKFIDIDMSDEEISKFMRVYVNYKKDQNNGNGIVLYFNYMNYLNTPFVKIDKLKVYPEIIEGTYLKLDPGESGRLDINLQFRYSEHGELRGVNNMNVMSYQIFNVSDDKPKFVMREIFRIGKTHSIQDNVYTIDIVGNSVRLTRENYDQFDFTITWQTTVDMEKISFDILFNSEMFDYLSPKQEDITIESISPSVATVTVDNPSRNYVTIPFKCMKDKIELPQEDFVQQIEITNVEVVPKDRSNIINIGMVKSGTVTIQ